MYILAWNESLSIRSWDVFALNIYGIFLFTYMLSIFAFEYLWFYDLHKLKSLPIDTMIVGGTSVFIWRFIHQADNLTDCLLWFSLFLFFLVGWEAYTMKSGYRRYFKADRQTLSLASMVRHLFRVLFYRVKKEHMTHWDEYRYWITIDGLLCIVAFLLFLSSGLLEALISASAVRMLVVAFGFYFGIFHIWRYRIVSSKSHSIT